MGIYYLPIFAKREVIVPNMSNPDTLKYRVSEPCAIASGLQKRIGAAIHTANRCASKVPMGQGSKKSISAPEAYFQDDACA